MRTTEPRSAAPVGDTAPYNDPRRIGDTLELPVVDLRTDRASTGAARSPVRNGAASLLMILLVAIAGVVAFAPNEALKDAWTEVADLLQVQPALDAGTSEIDTTLDSTAMADVPAVEQIDPESVGSPNSAALSNERPARWLVTGVADGLNLRAGPGVESDIVGVLEPGAVVEGTGRRFAVTGREWKEVRLGQTTGWAAAAFLASL